MTPERQAAIQLLRVRLAQAVPGSPEELALCAEAVRLVREERGIIANRVEEKVARTTKAKTEKAAKATKKAIDTAALLDQFIGKQS